MDSKILELMESANPQDRKRAIQMLAKMGGPEAIRYLGLIYKQESDPELKELAVSAGKYIKRQQTGENAAVQAPVRAPVVESYEEDEPEEDVEEEYVPVTVPAGKQSQARGLMDRAMELSMHGEKDKALESIAKAFKLDPNLRLDSYYMGVAMDITGMDKNETIRLVTTDMKGGKAKNKEKLKNDGSGSSEDVTWETALIDLTMYYVVVVGISLVGILLTNRLLQMSPNPMFSDQTLRAVGNLNLVMGLVLSLISGLIGAGMLLFHYAIMHLIATAFLGGDGTYRGLIHHGTTPIMVWTGLTGAISLATNYFTTIEMYNNPRQSLQTMEAYLASPIFPIMSVGMIVLGIVFLIWFCAKVGKNYEFGTARGCVTVIGWTISLVAISCACYFTLFSVLMNSLSQVGR